MGLLNFRRGPAVLYRACVSSRLHNCELIVFFEAARDDRRKTLDHLLHTAWGVDVEADIEAYNVISEHELLNSWCVGPVGDARLFETSAGPDGIGYVPPWRVQFLVSPPTLGRLLVAQANLPLPAERSAEVPG